ncbi:MAG: type II secretion system F family protein [Planctomycetota bacterium]|nr:type II secretion system F family protein [Planctomycetota bacterium]
MAKKIQRKMSAPTKSSSKGGKGAGSAPKKATGRRVSGQAVTDFTMQLATLSSAGIPLVRALGVLHGQCKPGPFKEVLAEVTEDVASGTPLSEALGKHSRAFDPLYAQMVKAGETGGLLDTILERLAYLRERAATITAKIRGAMVYPAMIVVVALVVISVVILFVIPRFQEIFDTFDVELPDVTLVLLNTADFASKYWYVVFGVPILGFLLHGLLMRRGGGYRYFMHKLMMRIPLIGPVLRQGYIAAFARTFGTLVQAGVPHLDALAITRDTSMNDVMTEAVEDIRVTVREGEGIATPMGEAEVFDDLVTNMVEVGEETGELDTMLIKVADAYEIQVDRKMDNLFKVLEPMMLVVMAVFVGFVVVALFMPLLEIMNSMGNA